MIVPTFTFDKLPFEYSPSHGLAWLQELSAKMSSHLNVAVLPVGSFTGVSGLSPSPISRIRRPENPTGLLTNRQKCHQCMAGRVSPLPKPTASSGSRKRTRSSWRSDPFWSPAPTQLKHLLWSRAGLPSLILDDFACVWNLRKAAFEQDPILKPFKRNWRLRGGFCGLEIRSPIGCGITGAGALSGFRAMNSFPK